MAAQALWREFEYHIRIAFRHLQMLHVSAIILCIVPGVFVVHLPAFAQSAFLFAVLALASLPVLSLLGNLKAMAQLALSAFSGRRYRTERYTSEEVDVTAHKVGLKKVPKVFLTENPQIFSPFTLTFTRTVYVPQNWHAKFPSPREFMPILGHEFSHVKSKWKNRLEVFAAFALVLVLAVILALQTVMLVAQIFEVLFAIYMVSAVSWRNEFRADRKSADALGPEGLISVFEQLKAESGSEEGSYTHPPLEDRINRLMKLLDTGKGKCPPGGGRA